MLDKMKYVNSKGQTILFGQAPYYIKYNEIRKYSWSYETYQSYNRIARFNRGLSERQLPVVIIAGDAADCTAAKNHLHDVIDYDVQKKQKGKLYIGDYYLNGYFFSSEPSAFLESGLKANINLSFVAEKSVWIKELKTEFLSTSHETSEASGTAKGLNSPPYGYPYDYLAEDSTHMTITNNAITDAAVVIIINGYAYNPSVRIGSNLYEFDLTVERGEYLKIDGLNKEAVLVDLAGNSESVFGYRNKEHDLFAKIPEGNNAVSWNGAFEFTVTLYEERTEPKWN